MRWQKFLANLGLGSRRQLEVLLSSGQVRLAGVTIELGAKVVLTELKPDMQLQVATKSYQLAVYWPIIKNLLAGQSSVNQGLSYDQLLDSSPKVLGTQVLGTRVLGYYKPLGQLCSRSDPGGRPTVFDSLPKLTQGRWISVGRLDLNSTGLLLVTNNGDLANKLMHPSAELIRRYHVRVFGDLSRQKIQHMLAGVLVEAEVLQFAAVKILAQTGRNAQLEVELLTGKNREVRRLFASQELQVNRLCRVSYGPIALPRDLKLGQWFEIDPKALIK